MAFSLLPSVLAMYLCDLPSLCSFQVQTLSANNQGLFWFCLLFIKCSSLVLLDLMLSVVVFRKSVTSFFLHRCYFWGFGYPFCEMPANFFVIIWQVQLNFIYEFFCAARDHHIGASYVHIKRGSHNHISPPVCSYKYVCLIFSFKLSCKPIQVYPPYNG